MKTFLKIFGVVIVLLIAAAIVLPFIFKDEIKGIVKNAANNNLNARVDFEDVSLSLFKSFPNLSVSVDELTVIGKNQFEGDTILSAGAIRVSADLMSIINSDVLKVKSIDFNSPKLFLYQRADGITNYDISLKDSTSEQVETSPDSVQSKFNIELQSYSITNAKIAYIDQASGMLAVINNLNHSGKGDFTQDDFVLDTETSIDELTFEMDGIKYLNKVKTNLDMQIGINLPNMKFTLKDNELQLNNLILMFDGMIAMPEEGIDLNLTFSSPRSDFKDIISLIPAIYKNDFSNLESSGRMSLEGNVKGLMAENILPAFNINLGVNNGRFSYPDLPTPINDVNMKLNIKSKGGDVNNTVINLSEIHLALGSEPIDGRFYVTEPVSGPNVDGYVKGKIDLGNVKKALDLKDIYQIEGVINSDIEVKGNLAQAANNYDKMDARGTLKVTDLKYLAAEGETAVSISNAALKFNPKSVTLENFDLKLGDSDIKASGSLNNVIAYVISDGVLKGNLNVTSNYFDFNPFLTEEGSDAAAEKETENTETAAFDVPENVVFTMNSEFKKLIYDNLELSNVKGQIIVKDSKVLLNDLNMNLLNGKLAANGSYTKTKLQENPDIQFNLNIEDFNVKETYDKFVSVQQFAPIAKYIQGSFSSSLKMNTTLDNTMMPVWETFFSNGLLNLKSAEIKNFKPFTTVGSLLQMDALSNPKLQNVKPKFEIKNGRFYLSPVEYKVGNYNVTLSGSNGIDQSIDYTMEIDVPADKLKNQANSKISGLLGKDVNLVKSNTIKVKALIGGTIESPNVRTSAADAATNVAEEVKDAVVDEAKAQVDKAKAETEQKLKEEAKKKEEELKKKLEEEAKKKLKKLFKWG